MISGELKFNEHKILLTCHNSLCGCTCVQEVANRQKDDKNYILGSLTMWSALTIYSEAFESGVFIWNDLIHLFCSKFFPDIKWSMTTPSKQCQQCLKNVPAPQNACTSTNISALFIFLPGKASEYKSRSAASILLSESNLTAASRPWADDRWWNVIRRKKGKKWWFHTKIISCLISGWFPLSYSCEGAFQKSDVPWNNQ